jgi:hypothetical protein
MLSYLHPMDAALRDHLQVAYQQTQARNFLTDQHTQCSLPHLCSRHANAPDSLSMYTASNFAMNMRKPASPFRAPCQATCIARRPLLVRAAAKEQRAAPASGIAAAALAAALLVGGLPYSASLQAECTYTAWLRLDRWTVSTVHVPQYCCAVCTFLGWHGVTHCISASLMKR